MLFKGVPSARDSDNNTPLYYAIEGGSIDALEQIVPLVLKSADSDKSLQIANSLCQAISKGHINCILELLECNEWLEDRQLCISVIRCLLITGSSKEVAVRCLRRVKQHACFKELPKALIFCLAVAALDPYFYTFYEGVLYATDTGSVCNPLYVAIKFDNEEAFSWLIKKKAFIDAITHTFYDCMTPIECAVRTGKLSYVKCLLDAGADLRFLALAGVPAHNHKEVISWLLLDKQREHLRTAVQFSQKKLVKRILEVNPSLLNIQDEYGNSLLHIAVICRAHSNMVNLLIKKGIRLDMKTVEGRTALDEALYMLTTREEVVELLLRAGAPFSQGDQEQSLLAINILFRDHSLVKLILEHIPHFTDVSALAGAVVCALDFGKLQALEYILNKIADNFTMLAKAAEIFLTRAANKSSAKNIALLLINKLRALLEKQLDLKLDISCLIARLAALSQ